MFRGHILASMYRGDLARYWAACHSLTIKSGNISGAPRNSSEKRSRSHSRTLKSVFGSFFICIGFWRTSPRRKGSVHIARRLHHGLELLDVVHQLKEFGVLVFEPGANVVVPRRPFKTSQIFMRGCLGASPLGISASRFAGCGKSPRFGKIHLDFPAEKKAVRSNFFHRLLQFVVILAFCLNLGFTA